MGLVTIVNAMFNCFIICSHPGFQAANANPDAPAGGGAAAGNDPSKLTDAQASGGVVVASGMGEQ